MINGIEAQFVTATETVTELIGRSSKQITHARKGDIGQVLHRETAPDGVELLTVLFTRSVGTAILGGNVKLIERERTSTPEERADTSSRMARAAELNRT